MSAESVLELADSLVFTSTGKHLNDLQRMILKDVWQRQTYSEIACRLRYTEGHIKDVASQLWQALSQALNERVTKSNSRAVLERCLKKGAAKLKLTSAPPPLVPQVSNFVGREAAIAHLNQLIARGHRLIVLQGEGGIGKTTLAQQYLEQQPFDTVLELLMAKDTANITPVEQVVEEWLRQDFQVEPGQDFGVTLDRLKRRLRERRVGILIDNLEPALDAQGRFWAHHSRYGDLLRVLGDPKGKTCTLLTSRDRLCEPGITVIHHRLPGLSLETWQAFWESHGIDIGAEELEAIHRAYGGNAKAMNILCSVISEDFARDGSAYWQDMQADPLMALDLKNLVASQVNRLQNLDPAAYHLFCRLGVYRYQDVPHIPIEGLQALMWDVEPQQHRQLIASLRNRSLLEGHKGQYWLHPVVQAVALERLRPTPDWETAHRQAMTFWTQSITTITCITDATQAFEACYHAQAIDAYEAAASVLLHSRHNQWGQYLTLGSTLYRMGLLQPVLATIPALLPSLEEGQRASELRNILADVYWISGKVHAAIATQKQAQAIACRGLLALQQVSANTHQLYYWRMLEVDACLSLGLYHLDLWELVEAAQFFQTVVDMAEGTPHHSWAEKASLCLALVTSHTIHAKTLTLPTTPLGELPQTLAFKLANQAYHSIGDITCPEYTGRFAFFIQLLAQTYTNLGETTRATELYERAIAFAEESHYVQVKAKALLGVGKLCYQQQDSERALEYMQSALALFEDLGAQGDLAEAHYHLGLTYQALKVSEIANTHYASAIHNFEAIQAPRQVAKVQGAKQQKLNAG